MTWVSASVFASSQHRGCLSPGPVLVRLRLRAWSSEPPRDSELPSHCSDTLTVCLNHLESENRFFLFATENFESDIRQKANKPKREGWEQKSLFTDIHLKIYYSRSLKSD